MSFMALQVKQFKEVHYNELNTGVVELLKKIINDGVTDEFYKWVDRDTFHKHKNDDDWFGGLLSTCWSFGNNKLKGYLFSPENERLKKPLHNIIVNRCDHSIKEFYELTGLMVEPNLLVKDNIQKRRLDVMNFVKKSIGRFTLEHIEHLERIQHLEHLQNLERLTITNKSYEDVEINTPIDETVIYLDPPYQGTEKYQHDIDFEKLYDYIRNSPCKIYISSYDMPFECVAEFEHRSTLSSTNNNKKVIEKLFCNQKEKIQTRLF